MNIYLIGFMGCGKSTVAAYLSSMMGLKMIELDEVIEEKEGLSIPDIFSKYGEDYFREQETQLIMELEDTGESIISCGGGAVIRSVNVESMKRNGQILLLTASPETIYERVRSSTQRPLLNNDMSVEHIRELIDKRREKYEMAADLVIETDHKTVEEICKEIKEKIC